MAAIIFEYNLTTPAQRRASIIEEPNNDIWQSGLTDQKETNQKMLADSPYDELIWADAERRISNKDIGSMGVKRLPGTGSATYINTGDGRSLVITPLNPDNGFNFEDGTIL